MLPDGAFVGDGPPVPLCGCVVRSVGAVLPPVAGVALSDSVWFCAAGTLLPAGGAAVFSVGASVASPHHSAAPQATIASVRPHINTTKTGRPLRPCLASIRLSVTGAEVLPTGLSGVGFMIAYLDYA